MVASMPQSNVLRHKGLKRKACLIGRTPGREMSEYVKGAWARMYRIGKEVAMESRYDIMP